MFARDPYLPNLPPKNALKEKPEENEPRLCCNTPDWAITSDTKQVAFGFWSKERPSNVIFGFGRARNGTRAIFRSVFDSGSSLLRNRTKTLATQATTSPNGELPRMLPTKSILPLRRFVFIGLPARGNAQSRNESRLKKGQNGGRSPKRVPSPL